MSPRAGLAALAIFLTSPFAVAHQQSQSLLRLTESAHSETQVRLDLALVDLEHAIGLDDDADAQISWGELRAHETSIRGHVEQRLILATGAPDRTAPCPMRYGGLRVDTHSDGTYAVLDYVAACPAAQSVTTVQYGLLFDLDRAHRSLVSLTRADGAQQSGVLSVEAQTLVFAAAGARWQWREAGQWISQGLWHIWMGYDHLLFLLTLLLPAVVYRGRAGGWKTRPSLRAAVVDVVRVVTAFTLAHSLTLVLASMGFVRFETRWVESAIALTVLLGAGNILFPFVRERRWALALVFGLIHGLGFAAALGDLGLGGTNLVRNLLLFNLGVEAGQLAIVAVFVPTTWLLRNQRWYRTIALPGMAVIVALLALWWLVERVAG
jgi:hypothetical protein